MNRPTGGAWGLVIYDEGGRGYGTDALRLWTSYLFASRWHGSGSHADEVNSSLLVFIK